MSKIAALLISTVIIVCPQYGQAATLEPGPTHKSGHSGNWVMKSIDKECKAAFLVGTVEFSGKIEFSEKCEIKSINKAKSWTSEIDSDVIYISVGNNKKILFLPYEHKKYSYYHIDKSNSSIIIITKESRLSFYQKIKSYINRKLN